MIWLLVLAILLLLFLAPAGVDFAKSPEGVFLTVKFGVLRIGVLPKREKPEPGPAKARRLERRAEKKKAKKAAKKAERDAKKQYKKEHPEEYPKKKPDLDKLMELARLGVRALNRFRLKLSFDRVRIHYTAGGDPYDAAVKYGRVSALMFNLPRLAESVLKVRSWDLDANCDFMADKSELDVRLIVTIQLWEVLSVAFAFGYEFIVYSLKARREKRRAERKLRNAEPVG